MKAFPGKLSLTALAALTPLVMHAQSRSIAYGRTAISFAPGAGQTLAAAGVTVLDLAGNPLPNGVLNLSALEGVVDLQTALGDVVFSGGLQLSARGQTIRIQDMVLETSSPTNSAITGQLIYNGTVIGPRQTIFVLNARPNYALPLAPQNGTLTLNGLSLGLSPALVNLVNSTIGQAIVSPTTQIGAANTYLVLSAAN